MSIAAQRSGVGAEQGEEFVDVIGGVGAANAEAIPRLKRPAGLRTIKLDLNHSPLGEIS